MKFVDAHCHLLHRHKGFYELLETDAYDKVFLMDLSGIELNGYDLATREEVLEAVKKFPEKVSAFGFYKLDDGNPDEITRLKEMGFRGLKVYKPLHPYNSECYYPAYARAQELHMPVLFHTGMVAKSPAWNQENGERHSYGPENMRPGNLSGIAEAFPELYLMNGHMGWPWVEETEQNLYYYRNIFSDVSGYIRDVDHLKIMLDRKCNDGTARYFSDKMMFASDSFYGNEYENTRSLHLKEFFLRYFEFVGKYYYHWGEEAEREKFFGLNAMLIQEYFNS